MRTLVLGGIKSGKSRWAETAIAESLGPVEPVRYLATGSVADTDPAWLRRIAQHRDRVAQSDERGRRGIIGNEDGGKILVGGPGPMKGTGKRVASAQLNALRDEGKESALERKTLDVVVVLVVDERGGVIRRRDLVAESGRPRGKGGAKSFSGPRARSWNGARSSWSPPGEASAVRRR